MIAASELPKSIGTFLRAEPECFREWMLRQQRNLVLLPVLVMAAVILMVWQRLHQKLFL